MMLGHLLRLKLLLLLLQLNLLLLLIIQLMMTIRWTFWLIWACMAIFFIWLANHSFKSWRNRIIMIKLFFSWDSNHVGRITLLGSRLLLIEIVWLLNRMLLLMVLSWLQRVQRIVSSSWFIICFHCLLRSNLLLLLVLPPLIWVWASVCDRLHCVSNK